MIGLDRILERIQLDHDCFFGSAIQQQIRHQEVAPRCTDGKNHNNDHNRFGQGQHDFGKYLKIAAPIQAGRLQKIFRQTFKIVFEEDNPVRVGPHCQPQGNKTAGQANFFQVYKQCHKACCRRNQQAPHDKPQHDLMPGRFQYGQHIGKHTVEEDRANYTAQHRNARVDIVLGKADVIPCFQPTCPVRFFRQNLCCAQVLTQILQRAAQQPKHREQGNKCHQATGQKDHHNPEAGLFALYIVEADRSVLFSLISFEQAHSDFPP